MYQYMCVKYPWKLEKARRYILIHIVLFVGFIFKIKCSPSLFNKCLLFYYILMPKNISIFHVHIYIQHHRIVVALPIWTEKEIVQADFSRSADVDSNRVSIWIRFYYSQKVNLMKKWINFFLNRYVYSGVVWKININFPLVDWYIAYFLWKRLWFEIKRIVYIDFTTAQMFGI